jgi:hypothetical protein
MGWDNENNGCNKKSQQQCQMIEKCQAL